MRKNSGEKTGSKFFTFGRLIYNLTFTRLNLVRITNFWTRFFHRNVFEGEIIKNRIVGKIRFKFIMEIHIISLKKGKYFEPDFSAVIMFTVKTEVDYLKIIVFKENHLSRDYPLYLILQV